MENRYLGIIIKYFVAFITINFILFQLFSKLVIPLAKTDYSPIFFDNFFDNSNIIQSDLANYQELNFFSFLFKSLSGNFETPWNDNYFNKSELENSFEYSIIIFLLCLAFICLIGFVTLYSLRHKSKFNFLKIFQNNFILYFTGIIFLILIIKNQLFTIYDPFLQEGVYGSEAFIGITVILTIFGLIKFLHEVSNLPQIIRYENGAYLYPELNQNNNSTKNFEVENIELSYLFLISIKPVLITLIELQFFLEIFFNIPGYFHTLFRAFIIFDMPMIHLILFQTLNLLIIFRLIIDLIQIRLGFNEGEFYKNYVFDKESNPIRYISYFFTIISLSYILFIGFLWFFTGYQWLEWGPYINPYFFNVNSRNIPAFTDGYILGTDAYGRDIFSLLSLNLYVLIFPILLSIIIRPVLIYIINLIPNYGDFEISYHIFDFMASIPRLFLSIPLFHIIIFNETNSLIREISFGFYCSLLFWGRLGKYNFLMKSSISKFSRWINLALFSALSIIIEFHLIYAVGFNFGESTTSWGSLFFIALQNYPSENFSQLISVVLFPLIFIIPLYAAVYNRLKNS